MRKGLYFIALLAAMMLPQTLPALADQPVVYSKTVVAIVPGNVIPKAIEANPAVVNQMPDANAMAQAEAMESEAENAPPPAPKYKMEVVVRPAQLPLDQGMIINYNLGPTHGVMTYFDESQKRILKAENIYKPVDILFIRNDGVIAQIVPEVMLAYLAQELQVNFPVRAYLYLDAGLVEHLGIKPGDRIEHGMFTPRPVIQKIDE